jgi:hypothetical protein
MATNNCPWLLMVALDCWWLLLATHECPLLKVATLDCQWLPLTVDGCPMLRIATLDCRWLPLATVDLLNWVNKLQCPLLTFPFNEWEGTNDTIVPSFSLLLLYGLEGLGREWLYYSFYNRSRVKIRCTSKQKVLVEGVWRCHPGNKGKISNLPYTIYGWTLKIFEMWPWTQQNTITSGPIPAIPCNDIIACFDYCR